MAVNHAAASLSVPTGESWHLLSVREVADACRLSEKAVRRAIDDGELPAVKLRSRLRIAPQDFEAWLVSCRQRGQRREHEFHSRLGGTPTTGTFRELAASQSGRGVEL